MSKREEHSILIKRKAEVLGFSFCGISKADFLAGEAPRLEQWLEQGMQGEMNYMQRNLDERLDPRKLLPGAKSVVSLMYNYHTDKLPQDPRAPRVSRYAYGRDYHKVLRKKLKLLLAEIRGEVGAVVGRGFVDSAPVMERVWAARGGIGWIGKNGSLINPQAGSYFFLAELVIDLELQYDAPITDHCADCDLCIKACPTGAIVAPYVVDCSRCISYYTIEHKGEIPLQALRKFRTQVFGCDICQDVCPFNEKARLHHEPDFEPKDKLLSMSQQDWDSLDEETFEKLFHGSAVKRAGFERIKRNVAALKVGWRKQFSNE